MPGPDHMTDDLRRLLPAGWDATNDHQRYTSINAPSIGGATVDWQERVFRAGWVWTGKPVNHRKYFGRGWKATLVRDAVAWLDSMKPTERLARKG